jgi:ubiquinone/menaquinone biosynthesis C-methylase UbiE
MNINMDEHNIDLENRVRQMYNTHPFPNRFGKLERRNEERMRSIYRDFLHIPIEQFINCTIIDAGCGTGDNTWLWKKLLHPDNQVIGLDQSLNSVRIANAADEVHIDPPVFAIGSIHNLGIRSNSIDLVFCSGVLVAVTNPQIAYSELIRILKPGGYIILVLYHKYGRALHGLRRAIIDIIEPENIDRRAELGGKLFGKSMQKLADAEQVPIEGVLYDQFGLPCESRYSVGQALNWYSESRIKYLGSWPPVEWSQLGKAIRFSYFLSDFRATLLGKLLLRIFPDNIRKPTSSPKFLSRALMQGLWGFNQQQLFAISGRKKLDHEE